MSKMRLDKFLSSSGIGTRTEVKKYIKNGRIKISGKVVNDAAFKIDTDTDEISFDDKEIVYEEYRYFMLNKPAGCVSATKDRLSETVLSLLDGEITDDLFPVGRLDKDTEGFLLITNDGKLAHELLSPRKHVDKAYYTYVSGKLSAESIDMFEKGLDIGDDTKTLPATISIITEDIPDIDESLILESGAWYKVVIHEGRYHQIKRMFEVLGEKVIYLKRMAMGNVWLDASLNKGEYRRLSDAEIKELQNR